MRRSPLKNLPAIGAIILIVVAGVAFYKAYINVQHLSGVAVASENVAPYTIIDSKSGNQYIHEEMVPKASITPGDLTWSAYQSEYADKNVAILPTVQLLTGQRIDKVAIAKDPTESFSIVSPDERVVAVNATVAGAALGTIQAGDVVDATVAGAGSSGGGTNTATYAKVICIETTPNGCAGVLPAGVNIASLEKAQTSSGSGTPVTVLLAVDQGDESIAGQTVVLSLNPFCKVWGQPATTIGGETVRPDSFVSTMSGNYSQCHPPTGRDASSTASVVVPSGGNSSNSGKGNSGSATQTTGSPTSTTGSQTKTTSGR